MSKKPYYITTAITYTSGKPHIGNTYEIILAETVLLDIKEWKAMTYFSRREQMSMGRRSS